MELLIPVGYGVGVVTGILGRLPAVRRAENLYMKAQQTISDIKEANQQNENSFKQQMDQLRTGIDNLESSKNKTEEENSKLRSQNQELESSVVLLTKKVDNLEIVKNETVMENYKLHNQKIELEESFMQTIEENKELQHNSSELENRLHRSQVIQENLQLRCTEGPGFSLKKYLFYDYSVGFKIASENSIPHTLSSTPSLSFTLPATRQIPTNIETDEGITELQDFIIKTWGRDIEDLNAQLKKAKLLRSTNFYLATQLQEKDKEFKISEEEMQMLRDNRQDLQNQLARKDERIHELQENNNQLQIQLENLHKSQQEFKNQLLQKDEKLTKMKKQLNRKNKELAKKDDELEKKDMLLAQKDNFLVQKENFLAQKESHLTERNNGSSFSVENIKKSQH